MELTNDMLSYLARSCRDGGIGANTHDEEREYRSKNPKAAVHTNAVCGNKIGLDKEQNAPR